MKDKLTMNRNWLLFSFGLFSLTTGEEFKICMGQNIGQCVGVSGGLLYNEMKLLFILYFRFGLFETF